MSPPTKRVYAGKSASDRASERVHRLLDAALDLFGTRGYASTTIELLCSRSNVSTRSFYSEVGGRPELLKMLVTRLNDAGSAAAVAALNNSAGRTITETVAAGIRAYLGETCANRRTARVCYVEIVGVSTDIEQWRSGQRELIVSMFAEAGRAAAERGEIAENDYRLLTLAMIGAANLFAQEWSLSTPSDGEGTENNSSFGPFVDQIVSLTDAVLTVS